jgi:lysophospholipase L1-like esterase
MQTPSRTLAYLISVAILLLALAIVIPEGGLPLFGNSSLRFITLAQLQGVEEEVPDEMPVILSLADSLEDIGEDTVYTEPQPLPGEIFQPIEWPPGGKESLSRFFQQLDSLDSPLHIFHFGDSQIESDRISSYLRYKLQGLYGGQGPGWVPAISFSKPGGVTTETEGDWHQFTLFGGEKHPDWVTIGPLCSTSSIGIPDSSGSGIMVEAGLTLSTASCLYSKAKTFNTMDILVETPGDSGSIMVMSEGTPGQIIPLDSGARMYTLDLTAETGLVTLRFKTRVGTQVHGICLRGRSGIQLHNVPMRGSSGTVFRATSSSLWKQVTQKQSIGMLLLQFGGNTMPYLEDSAECVSYASWFGSHAEWLKRTTGNPVCVLIGPADMAKKEGEFYVTYELLPVLRDGLKHVSHEKNMGYYDMLEAMGGTGSMSAWVQADPPLAMPDYTHFSPRGARLMGELIYESLVNVKMEEE